MTIYVDEIHEYKLAPPRVKDRYGVEWCHLGTDGPVEELHAFAEKIGLKRGWFQGWARIPHYDITPGKRVKAVEAGAVEVTDTDSIELCRKSVEE